MAAFFLLPFAAISSIAADDPTATPPISSPTVQIASQRIPFTNGQLIALIITGAACLIVLIVGAVALYLCRQANLARNTERLDPESQQTAF
jgi:hypothetical protein